MIRRLFCVLSLLLAALHPSFAAEAYDAATRAAIESVISKQLDAFAHDDAAGAASFASNGIRQKFPEPAKFLDMVKASYPALIKPRSRHFDEVVPSSHGAAQKVTVVAADGTIWTAVYLLEQSDGAWRITGCGLQKADQQDI